MRALGSRDPVLNRSRTQHRVILIGQVPLDQLDQVLIVFDGEEHSPPRGEAQRDLSTTIRVPLSVQAAPDRPHQSSSQLQLLFGIPGRNGLPVGRTMVDDVDVGVGRALPE